MSANSGQRPLTKLSLVNKLKDINQEPFEFYYIENKRIVYRKSSESGRHTLVMPLDDGDFPKYLNIWDININSIRDDSYYLHETNLEHKFKYTIKK